MNEHEIVSNPQSLPETPAPVKRARPSRAKPKIIEPIKEIVEALPEFIDPRETKKREQKEKQAREYAYDHEMVTGKFLFNECPGGRLEFPFLKWPGDQLMRCDYTHDKIYTIPRMVAHHLNDNCAYPEFSHNLDAGKTVNAQEMTIKTMIHRTNFIPLDFTSNVGYHGQNSIAQVSYSNPVKSFGR